MTTAIDTTKIRDLNDAFRRTDNGGRMPLLPARSQRLGLAISPFV